MIANPEQSELGRKSEYNLEYCPDKLFPISRKNNRQAIGIDSAQLPFYGFDYWNHYEVSWLNEKGKPIVALAEIIYGCDSLHIIESKSMKLYFNSLNHTRFKDVATVQATIQQDLAQRLGGSFLVVRIIPINCFEEKNIVSLQGVCIDALDIEGFTYHTDPNFLMVGEELVEETLYSDLLKSNCLVTNQPDWCSVQISYKGKKINQAGLLRYIVSFRNENEFHEQCIEKIFIQIMQRCQPTELMVHGRSTRRGGLDINAFRSSKAVDWRTISNLRLCRQ